MIHAIQSKQETDSEHWQQDDKNRDLDDAHHHLDFCFCSTFDYVAGPLRKI